MLKLLPPTLWLLLLLQASLLNAFSSGPPLDEALCTSMIPDHGVGAQSNNGITVELASSSLCYQPGSSVTVAFNGMRNNGLPVEIEGIMLMMKKPGEDSNAYGSIQYPGPQRLNTSACFGKANSVMHHTAEVHIYSFNFVWTPPQDLSGDIAMTLTVVEGFTKFYVGVQKIIPQCTGEATTTTTTTLFSRSPPSLPSPPPPPPLPLPSTRSSSPPSPPSPPSPSSRPPSPPTRPLSFSTRPPSPPTRPPSFSPPLFPSSPSTRPPSSSSPLTRSSPSPFSPPSLPPFPPSPPSLPPFPPPPPSPRPPSSPLTRTLRSLTTSTTTTTTITYRENDSSGSEDSSDDTDYRDCRG